MRPTALPLPALLLLLAAVPARAAEPPLHALIDQHIAAGWAKANLTPAALSDDAEVVRRVTLDLTGTIPTATAVRAFLDDRAADKRAKLIDRLLAGPAYASHMQRVFDAILLERQHGNY